MPKSVRPKKGREVPHSASARRARQQAENLASQDSLGHGEDEESDSGLDEYMNEINGVLKDASQAENLASQGSLAHAENEESELEKCLDKINGVMKDASQAGSACSPDFLDAILGDLELIQVGCLCKDDHEISVLIEEKLVATVVELKRLQENPELYPNKIFQKDFLQLVRKRCDGIAKTLQGTKLLRQARRDYSKFLGDFNQAESLPDHDEHRTPWQQFLHNHAPGSGIEGLRTNGEGCAYLLPPAGVRVVCKMLQDFQSAARDIQALSDDSESTIPPVGKVTTNISIEGNFRTFQKSLTAVRPTPTGSEREARSLGPQTLETLNEDFAGLDGRRQRSVNAPSVIVHEFPPPPALQERVRAATLAAAKLFE